MKKLKNIIALVATAWLAGCSSMLPMVASAATSNVSVVTTEYTQVAGPGAVGATITAFRPIQYVFSATQPAANTVGHHLDSDKTVPLTTMGTGIYMWVKAESENTKVVVTTTTDATISNGETGGGGGGDATAANQVIGNTSLDNIDDKTPALVSGRTPVDGSGVTQPISAASLPLPSGAATAANQSTGNTSLGTIATNTTGIATAANQATANTSLATIATNTTSIATSANQTNGTQLARITNGTQTADTIAGNVSGQNALLTAGNSLFLTGQTTSGAVTTTPIDTTNLKFISVQITAISSNTITFQESLDGTNYTSKIMYNTAAANNNGTATAGLAGVWVGPVYGKWFRLSASGGSSTYHVLGTAHGSPLHSIQLMAGQTGTWTVQPGNTANTTAWLTTPTPSSAVATALSNTTSTAYQDCITVKSSAGVLFGLNGYSSKTSSQFIQLHNATGTPSESAVPVLFLPVAASSVFSFDFGLYGRYFSTGIVACNSSSGPSKAIGASDTWYDAQYK